MIIYLGTKSPLKTQSVHKILEQFAEKKLVSKDLTLLNEETDSQVPVTPFNEQALEGARTRSESLYQKYKEKGDIFVGLESALVERYSNLFEECWCVIVDKNGKEYLGYSSGYFLPEVVSEHIKKGGSHLDIMKELQVKYNILDRDTWGIYTKNIISRNVSVEEAFRNAFASFLIKH
jgi:non-canonical (house-cleaning) NTP pyrophosphatase